MLLKTSEYINGLLCNSFYCFQYNKCYNFNMKIASLHIFLHKYIIILPYVGTSNIYGNELKDKFVLGKMLKPMHFLSCTFSLEVLKTHAKPCT